VLLYPDQLASVNVRSELWGCFLGPDRSTRLGGMFAIETMVVTTADGTEYGFRGRTGSLPARSPALSLAMAARSAPPRWAWRSPRRPPSRRSS
jgi:hypothetical protein